MKYILSFLFLLCLQSCKAQMYQNNSGTRNTAIGYKAFLRSDNPNFGNSIAVGNAEGVKFSTTGNIQIGYQHGDTSNPIEPNVSICCALTDSIAGSNNNIPIGNYSYYYPVGDTSDYASISFEVKNEDELNSWCNVSMATDTLIIASGSIHFIRIDGQTFEIKRSVTLEPVQKNRNWLRIGNGSGTLILPPLSDK